MPEGKGHSNVSSLLIKLLVLVMRRAVKYSSRVARSAARKNRNVRGFRLFPRGGDEKKMSDGVHYRGGATTFHHSPRIPYTPSMLCFFFPFSTNNYIFRAFNLNENFSSRVYVLNGTFDQLIFLLVDVSIKLFIDLFILYISQTFIQNNNFFIHLILSFML